MDDLTKIKGIGKAAAAKLVAAGIDSFEKLAHDGLVGEHGIKAEWISAAAELLHGDDTTAPSSGETGGPQSSETPAATERPQGTEPADKPESEAKGGDGNPAVPAEQRSFPVVSPVHHNGQFADPERGGRVAVTFAQHRALAAAGALAVAWEKGDPAYA